MWWRALIAGLVVAGVSEWSNRQPRLGALLLTLPIVSIVAFVMTWTKSGDMQAITQLARETLILVPLGLPFFIPFAFANRTGLSFWSSFGLGLVLAGTTIGIWFSLCPQRNQSENQITSPVTEQSNIDAAQHRES